VTEIIDPRQAEEAYQRWRKKHPEEAAKHDQEWLEMKKDPLKFKQFMESKGFHFSMSDEEFVKEHERLNMTRWERLKAWMKKKPSPEKKIKAHRRIAIVYACFAAFCFGMAFFNFFMLAQILKASNSPALEEMIKAWNSVLFLAGVSAISGIFAVIGLCLFILALLFYSCSLELRIKELEKKVEAHGMREEKN
jgi:hypothetical protein